MYIYIHTHINTRTHFGRFRHVCHILWPFPFPITHCVPRFPQFHMGKDSRCIIYFYYIHLPYCQPFLSPLFPPFYFLVSFYSPFIREDMCYLSFQIWLIAFSMMTSRSIHFHENDTVSFFWLNNTPLCVYTTFSSSIHLLKSIRLVPYLGYCAANGYADDFLLQSSTGGSNGSSIFSL